MSEPRKGLIIPRFVRIILVVLLFALLIVMEAIAGIIENVLPLWAKIIIPLCIDLIAIGGSLFYIFYKEYLSWLLTHKKIKSDHEELLDYDDHVRSTRAVFFPVAAALILALLYMGASFFLAPLA